MEIEDKREQGFWDRLKEKPVVKKLRGVKNIQIVAVIFIIAVGLIIYSSVMSATKSSESDASAMTDEETRLSRVLSDIDGAGRVETMITSQKGEIVGVIVIAEGADSITVRVRLLDAAATALGVDRKIVNVYSRKK